MAKNTNNSPEQTEETKAQIEKDIDLSLMSDEEKQALLEKENSSDERTAETKDLQADIIKNVKAVFETNPNEKRVFVCEDGSIFLEMNRSYANNHCMRDGSVKRVKPLEMVEVLRSEVE